MSAFDMAFSGTGPLILFLAKATVLLVAALVATATLRHSTAGARHLVWLAALVGVLALPVLSRIPSLRLGVLPSTFGSATTVFGVAAPPSVPLPPPERNATVASVASVAPPPPTDVSPAISGVPDGVPAGVSGVISNAIPALASSSYSLLSMLAIAWAFIALALTGWLVAGAIYVRRIVARAEELTSPDWTMPLCEVADRLDLEVPPRIVISDRIEMAFACLALAPTIVLPASARDWTDDRRRAVLFHELAHVKRHDLLGHTLGRLACALYWFHPLVWTAAKHLRAESERACDDLVLSCGARPSEYAQHLLDMVTNVRDHGAPVMALPMARKREFEGRMLAILDPAIRRASPGRLQATGLIATLGALSFTVAAVSPAAATPAPSGAVAVAGETLLQPPSPSSSPSSSQAPSRSPAYPSSRSTARSTTTSQVTSARVENAESAYVDTRGLINTIANEAAKAMSKTVTSALQDAGAALARQGRMQAADTGRMGLMIKILASDSDASVRRTAAWGLHDSESPDVRAALATALRKD
ncbi:MAG: M56 family metallopeptidase, partial [Gemmatimonadaceae bacterium]